jgi:hypothetical protein
VNANRIDLWWNDLAPNETGWAIERSTSYNGPWTVIYEGAGSRMTYTDATAQPGTTYHYRSRSYLTGVGYSPYTVIHSATTPAALAPTTPLSLKITFQPDLKPSNPQNLRQAWVSSEVPAGYQPDFGYAYAARGNGYSYGWTEQRMQYYGLDRDLPASPDQVRDTCIQWADSRVKWGLGLQNGRYRVKVICGELINTNAALDVRVEGTLAVSATQSSNALWAEGTVDVTVSDWRLDLTTSGTPGNVINAIEVTQLP